MSDRDDIDSKIEAARQNLDRINKNFNGSQNNKEIRMLRRRILKKMQRKTAKERFGELGGSEEPDPLERLRFFCSLAMKGDDWLDLEQFIEDVKTDMGAN